MPPQLLIGILSGCFIKELRWVRYFSPRMWPNYICLFGMGLGPVLGSLAATAEPIVAEEHVTVASTTGVARDPLTTPVAVHLIDAQRADANSGP